MDNVDIFLIDPIIIGDMNQPILLSEPNLNNYGSGIPSGIWEPYDIECIGAYLKFYFPEVNVFILQEDISDIFNVVENLNLNEDSLNIVSVSMYTFAMNFILDLFKKIKCDNVLTVVGGYHPSGDISIKNNPWIDYVILGEGEIPFCNLINEILNDDFPRNKLIFSKDKIDMESFIPPLRLNKYLKNAKSYPLAYPTPLNQINPAMITYSRGCYFNCSFCASNNIWPDLNVSYRCVGDVIDEIIYLKEKFNTNLLYWTDLAINNNRLKVKKLLNELIFQDFEINSFGYANQDLTNKDAKLFKDAGFSRLCFGVEALKPSRLLEIKNFQNLTKMKNALTAADKNGIFTRAYIMIGFPDQEPEDIYEIMETVVNFPIDQLRLGFYTPFVGTNSYYKYKNCITSDLSRFTTDLPVFNHHIDFEEEWLNTKNEVLIDFYNSEIYVDRVNQKILDFPNLKESYDFFFKEFKKFNQM